MLEPIPRRAKRVFQDAMDRPAAERAAFARDQCAGDAAMLAEVLSLLDAAANDEDGDDRPGERPGDVIGAYELQRVIGAGGFGTVWLAEQRAPMRRKVALKILKPGMDTRRIVARFEAERQALALMDHPNIARVFDGGATPAGRPFFVMELVDGVPITAYSDEARLSPRERIALIVAVCRAVQHAHTKGIIHRDLKPSNVLVARHDGAPVVKVIDFGVAKATTDAALGESVRTGPRQVLGTPEYMAPEQAASAGIDVDTRADVYSLGVLLYELLTGHRPFEYAEAKEAGYAELLRRIQEDEPPKPSTRVTTLEESERLDIAMRRLVHPRALSRVLRGEIDWMLMKALAKERGRRYESAAALADDLQRHLRHEPVQAGPPGAWYRLRRLLRRHRVGAAAGAAILASLVVGLAVSQYGLAEARTQATAAAAAASVAATEKAAAVAAREDAVAQKQLAEAAAKAAETQASRARKVTDLLREALRSSDPHERKGAGYTVRQLLEEFDQRLAAEAGDPTVEATLRSTIGSSYLGLGLTAKAEPHLRRSLALAREVHGERSKEFVAAQIGLADWLHACGHYQEAKDACAEALAISETLDDAARDLEGDAHKLLADYTYHLARYEESAAHARRSIEIETALHGEAHSDVACAWHNLGLALNAMDRKAEAEAAARKAVELERAAMGPGGPYLPSRISLLAGVLCSMGRDEEGEALAREALDARLAGFGPDHPFVADATGVLASALHKAEKLPEAIATYREAIRLTRLSRGEGSPAEIHKLHNLGLALLQSGNPREAEPELRQALALAKATYGAEHPETGTCLDSVGQLLLETRRLEEAVPYFRDGLAVRKRAQGPGDGSVAISLNNLAVLLTELRQLDEAETAAGEAVAIQERLDPEGRELCTAQLNLANVLLAREKVAEAEALYRSVLASLERAGQGDSEHAAPAWNGLARALEELRHLPDAEAANARSLAILRQLNPQGHPAIVTVLNNLSCLRKAQGDLAGAVSVAREAIDLAVFLHGPASPLAATPTYNLASMLLDLEQLPEAEEQSRRAVELYRAQSADHPYVARALSLRAEIQTAAGQFSAAVATGAELIAFCRRALANVEERGDAGATQAARHRLADGLAAACEPSLRLGQGVEAQALARECLELRASLPEADPKLASARLLFGAALAAQDRFAEAEPLLLQGAETVVGLNEQAAPAAWRRRALARVVEFYERWGKPAEAGRWRDRLPSAAK